MRTLFPCSDCSISGLHILFEISYAQECIIIIFLFVSLVTDFILLLFLRTLTSPVELIKCLRSIKEYAFSASPYPVIITLEDHLTPDLQAKVAQVSFLFIISISLE